MSSLLIIDDDPDLLIILDVHCTARGHKVNVALTCGQGLSLAAYHPPDLILLDFRLPKMDGARCIEILRADQLTKRTPVILMSAASPDWVAERLVPDQLVRLLEKPFDFASLDDMIADVLGEPPARLDMSGSLS